jgi:hypothetical protein
MSRPKRAHVVAFALAGTALALVGGICGYFGTDFGYHLWSAGRCATSSCILVFRTRGSFTGRLDHDVVGVFDPHKRLAALVPAIDEAAD